VVSVGDVVSEVADYATRMVEQHRENPRMAVAQAVSEHDVPADDREKVLQLVEDETGAAASTDGGRARSEGEAGIDGALLDDLEELLDDHRGPENAISSGEIADELGIDDSGSNPRTREAVKALLDERELPVISNSNGYFVATAESQVEEEIESLQSRIQDIQQRQQLIRDAWESNREVSG
jgi:hypothetical protein